jgi:outer membrane cobalamin receptor
VKCLYLIAVFINIGSLAAEALSGRVIDAETRRVLSGVTVRAGQSATTTDEQGDFSIDVHHAAHLVFSRIGYRESRISPPYPDPLIIRLISQPIPLTSMDVLDRTPVEKQIARQPSFTTVIERTAFENQTTSLPEVLDRSAGIQVRSQGGTGTFSTISVRGSSSEQVEVYLDDVLLNAAVGGGVNLANLPLANISRIEISRGSGPSGNGIGGTVQIRTQDQASGRTHMNASWGSFDTRAFSLFTTHQRGGIRYLAVADVSSSDNNFGFLDDNGTEYNPSDDQFTDRQNNAVFAGSVLGKADLEVGTSKRVSLSQTFYTKRLGIPGISNNQSTRSRLRSLRSTTQLSYNDRSFGDAGSARQTLYFNHVAETFTDTLGEIGVGRQDNAYRTQSYGHKSHTQRIIANRHLIGLMTDLRREAFDPTAHIQLITPLFASRRWTLEARGTLDLSFRDDDVTWTNTLDLRHQRSQFEGRNPFAFSPQAPDSSTSRNLGGAHSGLRAVIYGPFSLKANLSRSQRAPSFYELFGDRGGVVGNSSLTPERGTTVDLGVRFDTNIGWFEAVLFDHRYDDLIQFAQTSQFTSRPQNIGKARVRGIELSGTVAVTSVLSLNSNYTLQQSEDQTDVPHLTGNALPGRPQHKASLGASARTRRLAMSYDYSFEDGNFLDQANRRKLDARHIHSASLRVTVWDSVRLGLDVQNFTDAAVADLWGYPQPGRSWSISLQNEW